ncbi:MAG: ParB/RepB/Spo0J family partition protein [Defluviitaleaceae bacterium]|nr:ParB/RepB/Spo0J family partition protein [Defluviitaleaceae bacterium]MCL2835943.1 ParB/RepB/Spo0J family partition protein [Defluviitaleaceae bacterium]
MMNVMEERKLHEGSEVVYLPVDRIAPSPYQPRTIFTRESIEELANSIRVYGVMQPVTVRVINGSFYELVAGERRLRASKMAGIKEIPAIVVHINDKDSALLALIENIQRENLNFFDEAEGLKSLITDYGFTQEEIARKIGKNQSTVANKLRILRLPRDIRRIILDNDLTERHARALLRIPQYDLELIHKVLKKTVEGAYTVKETERLIERALGGGVKGKGDDTGGIDEGPKQKVKSYFKDIRIFKNTIEQAVGIMANAGLSAEYDIEEREDGCIISILVSYT